MAVTHNIKKVQLELKQLGDKYTPKGEKESAVVGYTANYAVYVHEIPPTKAIAKKVGSKRSASHHVGQWKFLETPARRNAKLYAEIIRVHLSKGAPLIEALYLASAQLQADSQRLVPILTGNLRLSAFIAKEDELDAVAEASKAEFKKRHSASVAKAKRDRAKAKAKKAKAKAKKTKAKKKAPRRKKK